MAISDQMMKMTKTKLKLSDLNPHLMCVLCGGYYIDATTIVECLHSFCRSCIVKHLEGSKYCPICEVQVHKTKPLINIRPDKTLQDIVYKLVPGLFASEMRTRRVFYQERPHYIKPDDSESVGEISHERIKMFVEGDNVTFSLNYLLGPSPVPVDDKYKELNSIQSEIRYFRCPTGVTIHHLKKLLKAKYELRGSNYKINIFLKDMNLSDDYTLLDISYIFLWMNEDNLFMTFKIYECPIKRRRRRYFGGVDELPAHYTPLSILQSRLGIFGDSLAENSMTEGRRHLRSDIEKKKKEIEKKMEKERRLLDKELGSNDEKKKDKDTKTTESKRKKRDKNKNTKSSEEKKKKKDKDKKKCHEEKRKEKDVKEDKDESGKENEAKEERMEVTKEEDHKRKREEEQEEKSKREKLDDTNERNLDEVKEVNEDVSENIMSGEMTTATESEPALTQEVATSISTIDATLASASTSDFEPTPEPNTEPNVEEALKQDSEPVTTTATDNTEETEEPALVIEETPVISEPTSTLENGTTSPENNENTEVQLQISESGVMSMSPVPRNSEDVIKTVEEKVCGRVTRRSSITSVTPQDTPQDTGKRVMKKRGPKPKKDRVQNEDGSLKNKAQNVSPKSPKLYKTIRRSPNIWHPTISKDKLKSTLIKSPEEASKPAKFFKLRNRSRALEFALNEANAVTAEPVSNETEEQKETPRQESEKEDAQVEPQNAQAVVIDKGDAEKPEGEKSQLEEEKQKEEGENHQVEEENKAVEPTSTSNGDPKDLEVVEEERSNVVEASASEIVTNLRSRKSYGSHNKEDRTPKTVGSSASNLLTNPFIPNSNHFLFSDVTLPANSGNLSKSAEVEKNSRGKGGAGGTKHGVNSERGNGSIKSPTPNGTNCSALCFLDPCRLVYPYHAYPLRERDTYLQSSRLSPFGDMNIFSQVSGFHTRLPPCINHHSSPQQNHGVGLASAKKSKGDSTKEKNQSGNDALNTTKPPQEKERRKRRKRAETETTNYLKTQEAGKESNKEVDAGAGDVEKDDDLMFVPAKRKRDEKGSRDERGSREKERNTENGGKKDKPKDDKAEKEKEKGDERLA